MISVVDRHWQRFLLFFIVPVLAACTGDRAPTHTLAGYTMGTSWSVKLVGDEPLGNLQGDIESMLAAINANMSTYQEDSALSRFNAEPAIDWQPVPAELAQVAAAARTISITSDGAFDVTIGPLVNLWGFGPDGTITQAPDAQEIDAARRRVGYRKLEVRLDPPALRKAQPDLYVDLSAIAKGYGVDRVVALLQARGFNNYLVEIGGELRGRGNNGSGIPWRIAVEKPDGLGRSVEQIIPLQDAAMATSGDYRNFFIDQGRRYSHTIDVLTGRPVTHSLASVTVIAASCMQADGLATALIALGPLAGYDLALREDIAALFIERTDSGFRDRATPAFEKAVLGASTNA